MAEALAARASLESERGSEATGSEAWMLCLDGLCFGYDGLHLPIDLTDVAVQPEDSGVLAPDFALLAPDFALLADEVASAVRDDNAEANDRFKRGEPGYEPLWPLPDRPQRRT